MVSLIVRTIAIPAQMLLSAIISKDGDFVMASSHAGTPGSCNQPCPCCFESWCFPEAAPDAGFGLVQASFDDLMQGEEYLFDSRVRDSCARENLEIDDFFI